MRNGCMWRWLSALILYNDTLRYILLERDTLANMPATFLMYRGTIIPQVRSLGIGMEKFSGQPAGITGDHLVDLVRMYCYVVLAIYLSSFVHASYHPVCILHHFHKCFMSHYRNISILSHPATPRSKMKNTPNTHMP
jgi:hypothetical protein